MEGHVITAFEVNLVLDSLEIKEGFLRDLCFAREAAGMLSFLLVVATVAAASTI